ncbi:MAG: DNA-binding transcriptional regulator [Rhodospirillales bacterium]|nr:DNA-binding transcriptional regulator [Rhodospirillales bacterium]
MAKSKHSRILEEVHEGVKGLHRIGLVDDMTMKEFDALCLPPVKRYTPAEIKRIRLRQRVSQPVFAAYLNVTKSTVTQWEQGEKTPRGTALKLLELIERKGLDALT